MVGRAVIEGSESNVAMGAWLPEPSYPCGNFSDSSYMKSAKSKGSIGHGFELSIRTGNQNQVSLCPFTPGDVSVLAELTLVHLRYRLTDVPPSHTPHLTVSSERIALDGTSRCYGCSSCRRLRGGVPWALQEKWQSSRAVGRPRE
ncbi:hypothetical protein M514_26373 [Trichuris suis]|uniref:Regulator of rDNA transcription protein 15 n=1 Tax=Trichuris suis TaxID=68888 RepID=A0A085MW81_9BILA|nr:hypothetical protein M514_26373 [Trichuris suis]